jgi:heme/copper-type cytochrome/quinol oxidase subunit 2
MAQDTGLVKRGLVLLVLVVLLAATVLFVMFQEKPASTSKEIKPAEPWITLVPTLTVSFPASVNWLAIYQLVDALPSAPGWDVRYDATKVLAMRGSPKVPLPILREMLDEERQLKNFRTQLKDGRVVPKVGDAQNVLLIALKALHEWLKHADAVAAVGKDNPELQKIYAAVDKLAEHANANIKNEARKVQLARK